MWAWIGKHCVIAGFIAYFAGNFYQNINMLIADKNSPIIFLLLLKVFAIVVISE